MTLQQMIEHFADAIRLSSRRFAHTTLVTQHIKDFSPCLRLIIPLNERWNLSAMPEHYYYSSALFYETGVDN